MSSRISFQQGEANVYPVDGDRAASLAGVLEVRIEDDHAVVFVQSTWDPLRAGPSRTVDANGKPTKPSYRIVNVVTQDEWTLPCTLQYV